MIVFELMHPHAYDMLGIIPGFLSDRDTRPAREQFNTNYAHGGGWRPLRGFRLTVDNALKYPGDPLMRPIAQATLRDELIVFYPHGWVAIVQLDHSFEVSRMD